jgi:hypothetical protein
MKHFLLIYDLPDDYVTRRAEFRDAHLTYAWAAQARGDLLLAGALADPVDRAYLVFAGDDPSVAANFAMGDPYVCNGLITKWMVREWGTVVGTWASKPVRPGEV